MLTQWIRLIKDSTDVSLDNQGSGTIAMDGSSPTLYLGKKAPFNNFFMWFDTVNSNSVTMTVEYYDNNAWVEVVDLLDGTSGATQSGVVQFSPDRKNRWSNVDDSSEKGPTELSSFTIYDMYWIRITFSGDLSAGTALQEINYKFTTQEEVLLRDNDINEFLTSFGQTNWLPQILSASLEVANDFKKKGLISDEGQILRFDDVSMPTVYKTLFIIYLNLGESYKDRRKEINDLYEKSFVGIYTLDKNSDGFESKNERSISSNRMER
jgi:hypothetical protein